MITLTSRAPWLLVNHYRGKGCIPGSRVCFHRAGFIAGQGALAMFGLYALTASQLALLQPCPTRETDLVGNWSVWVGWTPFPVLLTVTKHLKSPL